MRPKYTMAIAVITVALMMGGALVPLLSDNGYDSESADISYNSTSAEAAVFNDTPLSGIEDKTSGLLSLLTAFSSPLSDTKYSSLDSAIVPVNNTTDYGKVIKWDGSNVSGNNVVVGLYGGQSADLTKANTGSIKEGATLVLFPTTTSEKNFSFTITGDDDEIRFYNGSYIDIFGMKFKFVFEDDEEYVMFMKVEGTVTIDSAIDATGAMNTYLEIGKKSNAFVFMSLYNTTDADQTRDNAALKVSATKVISELNKVKFEGIKANIDAATVDSGNQKTVASLESEWASAEVTPGEVTETSAAGSVTFESAEATFGMTSSDVKKGTTELSITNAKIPSEKTTLGFSVTKGTVESKTVYAITMDMTSSVKSDLTIESVNVDSVVINGIKVKAGETKLTVVDDEIEPKNSKVSAELKGEFSLSVDSFTFKTFSMKAAAEEEPIASATGLFIKIKDVSFSTDGSNMDLSVGELKVEAKQVTVSDAILMLVTSKASFDRLATIDDLSLSIEDVKVSQKVVEKATTVDVTVKSAELKGKVKTSYVNNYPITLDVSISDVAVNTSDDGVIVKVGKASLNIAVRYDGQDRNAKLYIEDVYVKYGAKKVDEKTVQMIVEGTVKKIEISCDVPFKTMGFESLVPCDVNASVEGYNLAFEIPVATPLSGKITGEKIQINNKTAIPGAPYIEEMEVEVKNFEIQSILKAESVSGFLKNYGESKQNFTIKDDVQLGISDSMGLEIIKGKAEFSAGYLPVVLDVDKDAIFTADGLSAYSINFQKGVTLSGIVAINTKEAPTDGSRTITYDGKTIVSVNPVEDKNLASAGYTLLFDIGTLAGGKLIADAGTTMPEWKAEYGTPWTVSEDKQTATYDTGNGATFTFETEPKSYKFAYSGEEPVEKKYGQIIVLKEVPAKEGVTALGWSDGSETVYAPGVSTGSDAYKMPARDVTLTPVYMDVAPVEAVSDKAVKVSTDKASTVVVSNESLKKVTEGGSLTIAVVGGQVKMSDETLKSLIVDYGSEDLSLVLSINEAKEINDDVTKKIVGNGTLYNVTLQSADGAEFFYRNNETFQVSLDVKVNGKVDYFKISYLGDSSSDYAVHSVGVSSFSQSDDNNCNVTFECNHFSDYIIEPVYKGTNWGLIVTCIVLGVIVVALIIFAAVRVSKSKKAA